MSFGTSWKKKWICQKCRQLSGVSVLVWFVFLLHWLFYIFSVSLCVCVVMYRVLRRKENGNQLERWSKQFIHRIVTDSSLSTVFSSEYWSRQSDNWPLSFWIRFNSFNRGPNCILKILSRCSSWRRRSANPSIRCSSIIGVKVVLPSTSSKNVQTSPI